MELNVGSKDEKNRVKYTYNNDPSRINKRQLIQLFEVAKDLGHKYILVLVDIGLEKPEAIINERENFDAKLEYYLSAYDDDLIHRFSSPIKIINAISFDKYKSLDSIVGVLP